jgi:hypothetical protein
MGKLRRLPGNGTKDRAKLEAMRRAGGARQSELQDIDGNGGCANALESMAITQP